MNWEALGAVGEVVGAFAVVLTLFYFAYQLRQNTKSVNSSNFNHAMQGFNLFNTTLMTDPQLTRIFYQGHADPYQLKEEERLQYLQMMSNIVNIYRNLLHQYRSGSLPQEYWDLHAQEAKQIFMTEGGLYFRKRGPSWNDLFHHLDEIELDDDLAFSEEIWPLSSDRQKDGV